MFLPIAGNPFTPMEIVALKRLSALFGSVSAMYSVHVGTPSPPKIHTEILIFSHKEQEKQEGAGGWVFSHKEQEKQEGVGG